LQQHGFKVTELRSVFGAYAPALRIARSAWLAATMAESLARTLRANHYDLRFLQRNMTATLCTWEPWLRKPFVFDVDDSIFLGARGASAERIARLSSLTICGNNFLANHFGRHGPVAVLPTAVDTTRFVPRTGPPPARPVIGWSGSSSGLKYLYGIEPALQKLLARHPEALFKVVSDQAPAFKTLPSERVIYERWSPDREVAALHGITVGIMPLEDDLWARGKCSFKMLTYMSAGLPVVVSPVGMNQEILAQGPCGLAAKTADDWVDAMSTLLSDAALASQMGRSGRQIVEARYARNVIAPQLGNLLKAQL
jgi:glycosyltransferase involved in cell wall biosynthesis